MTKGKEYIELGPEKREQEKLEQEKPRQEKIDARNRLDEEVFSFHTLKDGRVMLYWYGKQVKMLSGTEATRFLQRIEGLEGKAAQLVMAKVTGNFKHGNERNRSPRR